MSEEVNQYSVCRPIQSQAIENDDPLTQWPNLEAALKEEEPPKRRHPCILYDPPEPEIKLSNEKIKYKILKEMNKYRRMHCACRLILTDKLNEYAQKWADALAAANKIETRVLPRYGESIFRCRKKYFDITRLIRLWYQEKYNYKYAEPKFGPYSGHFTQMVWCDTRELGIGIAQDRRIWIVCNFRPPGNIKNQFPKNVLPRRMMLSSSSDSSSSDTEEDSKKKCKKKRKISLAKSEYFKKSPPEYYCDWLRKKCRSCPDFGLHLKHKKT